MDNFTAEQKAYHFRKMRTCYTRMDVDKDDHIILADYKLMAKRMVEYGKLSKDKADVVYKKFREIAASCCKSDEKVTADNAVEQAHDELFKLPVDQWRSLTDSPGGKLFHVIDTNSDGAISTNEFAVYFMALGFSKEESKRLYDNTDADNNREISYEEFVNAANNFYLGMEELSKAFFGCFVDPQITNIT